MTSSSNVPASQRVTLRFRSDSGREYLYDDITGSIFPWDGARESVLVLELSASNAEMPPELMARYGEARLKAARRFIRRWRGRYSAFARCPDGSEEPHCPPAAQLEHYVRNASFELLLILTENCNLRCKYCALSGAYPLNRQRSARRMTLETARRAVDWYVEFVQPQIARSSRKRFGLSLYGGEPLMNMPVVTGILEYCRERYPETFVPVMTTNGTLLTPDKAAVLVEHGVMLAISIDGPELEHDRMRVDARNRGTHARVAANLRRLRHDHLEYWTEKVVSISVYDCGTDLESTEKFFRENADSMPRSVFVNQVGAHNTSWYSQYGDAERNRVAQAMARLQAQYKTAKVRGEAVSYYLNSLIGMDVVLAPLRQRVRDQRPGFLPFSGACIPGSKVAIHVDGTIDMCERVNGSYPLGHLDRGGIDYERLRGILDAYRSRVLSDCHKCPATRQCSVCFSHVEGQGDFAKVPQLCAGVVQGAQQRLANYVSILEQNPRADFHFETDTSRLEERLLLIY
jgi:uncharacterized protein